MTAAETLSWANERWPDANWMESDGYIVTVGSVLLPSGIYLPVGAVLVTGTQVTVAVRPNRAPETSGPVVTLELDGERVVWPCSGVVADAGDIEAAVSMALNAVAFVAHCWARAGGEMADA